ncbi:MAG: hypothetical protein KDB53_07440, partial [Planctomycetes bacterium]|nr:hypothetical protein [Planctomycetota bacterium]
DACRVIGNQAPGSLGLDVVLLGNFVFRDDLAAGPVTASAVHAILPLHQLTRTGFDADELDFIDLPGGLRQAGDPSGFPVPNPNLTGITALEYFLELVYGIGDLLAQLGGILGFDLGAIDGFIDGLQWSGIEFTIDDTAPVLQRIDPASIIVGGVPLVGNESMNVRLGLNAIIARVAMPFFQLFATVEEPVGSGILVGFPNYDPVTNASGLIIWEALRDHLAGLGQIDANRARVGTDRPRSLAPDLSFNPADVGLPAFVAPGTAAQIVVPVINLGATAVTAFSASLSIDPTPDFVTDDPDGFTDARTGFDHPIIGTAVGGAVSAQGQTILTLGFMLPANLPAGVYPLRLRIGSVQSADPTRPESIRSNNQLGIGKLVVGKF